MVNKHKHDDDVKDVEDEGLCDDRDPRHPSVKSGAAPAKKVKLTKLRGWMAEQDKTGKQFQPLGGSEGWHQL